MQQRHVLTFNWHDPYLHMFAQTGFRVSVGDWMRRADGTTGWDYEKRPLPENLHLLTHPSEAAALLKQKACDVVICHTLQDLSFVAPFDVPTIYLTHNALQNDGLNDQTTMAKLRQEVHSFLLRRKGVFAAISPMKHKSWDLDGFVVRPGINLDDYEGYTGEEALALSVGNLFVERDHMLGYRYLKDILGGAPHRLLGVNPQVPEARKAEHWDDLKQAFRTCRVYVNTTVEAFEDGYNLGMLEAMATGMPVVCLANASSPIRDGENGFVSDDTGYLNGRVKALLQDLDLAKRLGAQARETVAEQFSVSAFADNWHAIVDESIARYRGGASVAVPEEVDLHLDRENLFPYTWDDVSAFLDVATLDQIAVPKLKLDRVGNGFLCDICLADQVSRRTMVWQGIEVLPQAGGPLQIAWPHYLEKLDAGIRGVLEGAIEAAVKETAQAPEAQVLHVDLGGSKDYQFQVGDERITPGAAPWPIYQHHAKRYAFAGQFCAGKRVVDLGAGTGYGAKVLSPQAALVVGVDLSTDALHYGARTFGAQNIFRAASDMQSVGLRDGQFDVAVCFEAMEHIQAHDAVLDEVRRLLKPDGCLLVSMPNPAIYELPENANAYHVGMLDLKSLQTVLNRHFEQVSLYGQMRATDPAHAGRDSDFDFHAECGENDEVFVAVCRKPRAVESPEEKPQAPAVHTKATVETHDRGARRLKVLVSHVSNPISTGRYYVDAFRKAHDVLTCGPVIDAEELAQWREAEKQHAFKRMDAADADKLDLIGRLARPCDIEMPRGQVDMGQVLDQLPHGWRPDLFVWADSATGFLPMGLEKLDCPTACLVGDTHTGQMQWRLEYARLFSHAFVMFTRQHMPHFEKAGCAHVQWLPGACDPNVHGVRAMHKSFDIGFVGQTHRQWHPDRVRLLQCLMDAGFDVQVESKILEDMAVFFSRSKIVFNRSLNEDLNMRVFEALCSGSLLLTDRLPQEAGLETLFQDRKHLVLYDEDTLEDLVRYYLENEAEREAIAAAGRQAVLAEHTYAHRADQIVAAAFGESAGIAACVDAEVGRTEALAAGRQTRGREAPTSNTVDSGQAFVDFLKTWRGPVRLNLGCGDDRREGYINVDAYVPTADVQMDVFDLRIDDGSVDEIFSSHMLEHLGKYDVPQVLKEWRRVLRPGGLLKLNLPDLEWAMAQWLRLPEESRWGWALDTVYGLQTHPGEYHKTGFTVARAEALLASAGFARVQVSWVWSHGLRCLWCEAQRPEAGAHVGIDRKIPADRFASQFTVEMSDWSPYTAHDVTGFLTGDGQVGLVSFQKLPMDQADYVVNVAVRQGDRQMVLSGIRIFDAQQNPMAIFPAYLDVLDAEIRQRIGHAIGQALNKKQGDASYRDGDFVMAQFGASGDLGLEKTGERVVPGLTDMSLYIPHMKRYLLAEQFARDARVLDAGCGTGYGAKRLAQVAAQVTAVDIDADSIGFAQRTYADDRIAWQQADLRTFAPEESAYDLVTSFEVIEHLSAEDIPAYLDRLSRALRPGGVALISTPNKKVAEKWHNPHHQYEMTRDEFHQRVSSVFGEVAILGQAEWSPQVELPGQCVISGRVTDADDMYIAVCVKREATASLARDEMPRVSIVMPLYNKADFTEACLAGLDSTRGSAPFEVILVDNGSTDDTAKLLDRVDGQPGYRVIRNGENLGFARGNNLGAQTARGNCLLFLNNDTVPHPGWLDAMVKVLDEQADVGIVGARLLYPDTGRVQHAGLELINGVPDHVHRHALADAPEVMQPRDLDMVTGACLLIRRDVFEQLGGFDEGYVNGVEDVDLCLRVRDLGYRVHYCAEAVLDHYEGTSDGRFDHVRPNLERFVARWNGRFDAQGRFVPERKALDAPQTQVTSGSSLMVNADDLASPLRANASVQNTLRGVWEGTQFVYHSLSLINMALTSELIQAGADLKVVPFEDATFGPEVDPERLGPIAERLNADLSGPAQFHVRHMWPPNFDAPPEGHWIMIQPWEFGRVPKAWVQPIQAGVDEVWVPSSYAKRCYVDSGVDADRVFVIPNGVRADRMHPEAEPLVLETGKAFKFLFVGGAIFRKGIDVLLKVYRQTFTRDDDVCLVIKGMGDASFYKGQTAAETIRQMQADPNAPEIVYLDRDLTDEEMAGLYTACNCLVHPYRGEGFGMPVAEAMACGLPVIVTRGGACDDFCNDQNAYFVPAQRREIQFEMETAGPAWLLEPDPQALAQQMKAAVADPAAGRLKGAQGSAYVREHLTWQAAVARVMTRLHAVQEKPIRRLPQSVAPVSDATDVDVCLLVAGREKMDGAQDARDRFINGPVRDVHGPAELNALLAERSGAYIALIRDDVIVTDGWLDRLLTHFAQDEQAALVAPRLPIAHGAQATKPKYKSTKRELQRFAKRLAQREKGQREAVQTVAGACVVLRRDVLNAFGGFDGRFESVAFLDDFIRRAQQMGFHAVCAQDVFVHCEADEDSALEVQERLAVARLAAGDVHRAQGAHDQALTCYREALDNKPDYLEAALVLSTVLLEQNRPQEAVEVFQPLVEKHPESSRLRNYLGRSLYLCGKRADAQKAFEDAIELDPNLGEAHSNLGVLLWETGALDAALEQMGRAAECAPDSADVIYNIGMIYAQLGQGTQAAEMLQHYLTVSPDDLHARTYLAVLLLENGAEQDGVSELEYVLNVDPEHPEALRVLGELQAAADAANGDAQDG